ncbi:MAG: hypothetical protein M1314_03025 [Firmicutes bacterium]|nr:hypothetical protein [Bacillota bacterium]
MTPRKAGTSPHTRYRRARKRLSDLEVLKATLERSRPRTPGKKGAKTRALNKLTRRVSAARGQVTKARNVIARAASERAAVKNAVKYKRSEAATKGWAKRRVGERIAPFGDHWQHLRPDGTTITVVVDKTDSSLEGKYWNMYGVALDGKGDLRYFEGLSVFDFDRQRRFPFVTDLDVIAQHADEIDFGPGFYKRRNEAPGNAA